MRDQILEVCKREHLLENITEYMEPFAGSGPVALALLASEDPPSSVTLSDTNQDLVMTWSMVKDEPQVVAALLEQHIARNGPEYFQELRSVRAETLSQPERAARFLYLLGASFKGLWRTNASGAMNAPYGHATLAFTSRAQIMSVAHVLRKHRVKILHRPFEITMAAAKKNTLCYCDPPYLPRSATASFTGYGPGGFDLHKHYQLAELARRSPATVMISGYANSLTKEMYKGAECITVETSHKTGRHREVVSEGLYLFRK